MSAEAAEPESMGGAPETIVFDAYDARTRTLTDPDGNRIAVLDPDGAFSAVAVAVLAVTMGSGCEPLELLSDIQRLVEQRYAFLPPNLKLRLRTALGRCAHSCRELGIDV
mgnify:FL=1|jgi:hypothetical protein